MNDLLLCTSCKRHFRASEARCPFCDAAAPAPLPFRAAPRGLSRAKLYALHAAALATGVAIAAACGGDVVQGSDASTDGSSNDAVVNKDASPDSPFVFNDAAPDDGGAQDVSNDWGPPPPPYGCVFPGGCRDLIV
jgi:hypothetical protein